MKIKMKKSFFIISVMAALLLTACSTSKNLTGTGAELEVCKNLKPIYVTNTKKIHLLKPKYAFYVTDSIQLLTGSFDKTNFALLSYTQIDTKGINLSLFNDFGSDMGNLSFDGNSVKFDSAYFPSNLPAEYIVNDIQNAFYDLSALTQNYANSKLRFEEELALYETGGSVETRRIYDGKKLIEEIIVEKDTITIKNYLRGYSYTLQDSGE